MRSTVRVVVAPLVCASLLIVPGSVAYAEDTPMPTPAASSGVPVPTSTPSPSPSGTPTPTPTPTATAVPAAPITPLLPERTRLPLRKGHYGAKVATAQERLKWLGYEISEGNLANKMYGKSTVEAVRKYQVKFWLPATGKLDKRTWKSLARTSSPVGVLPNRCTEKTSICIDKTQRVLRYVVKGKVKLTLDALFGAPGMETGEGLFTVKEKSYNHVSSRYRSWMPRAMFFNGDEAVHYSPDFASIGYARGSHGCVGVRDMEKATWLFEQVPVGTRVYVYWSP